MHETPLPDGQFPADILVVDDELSMRQFLQILLERNGYRVETASSGEDALVSLEARDFDLVMTDLSMPGIDGMELVRRVRSGTAVQHDAEVPIIMITAHGTTANAVQAMKEGANDYVSKPIDIDKLMSLMRVWLPR